MEGVEASLIKRDNTAAPHHLDSRSRAAAHGRTLFGAFFSVARTRGGHLRPCVSLLPASKGSNLLWPSFISASDCLYPSPFPKMLLSAHPTTSAHVYFHCEECEGPRSPDGCQLQASVWSACQQIDTYGEADVAASKNSILLISSRISANIWLLAETNCLSRIAYLLHTSKITECATLDEEAPRLALLPAA